MRAHTITTKASTIVPGGILALGLAVVLLAATASTASADTKLYFWCAPLPTTSMTLEQILSTPPGGCGEPAGRREVFDFGDRKVGTTSPAQGFALFVDANGTFNPRISVSGDYTQTNNCLPTLPFPQLQPCLITVTFTPTGTGPKRGTLRTGPRGPTVALTGNGVTTRTPPVLPLTLDVDVRDPQQLRRTGVVSTATAAIGHCHVLGCPDYDATLVLGGDVKKTTKQLPATVAAGGPLAATVPTTIKARLKHLKQLRKEPTAPKIKIKFTATDEFGQTATDERKVELCSRLIHVDHGNDVICRWHPSQK